MPLLPSITGTPGSTLQASISQKSTSSASLGKSNTIFVAGFQKWAKEEEIRKCFSQTKFEKFKWMAHAGLCKTNKNYCFITYKTVDEAKAVKNKMNGLEIFVTNDEDGGKQFCKLDVTFAKSKPRSRKKGVANQK